MIRPYRISVGVFLYKKLINPDFSIPMIEE